MTVKVPSGGTRGTSFPRAMVRFSAKVVGWMYRHGIGRSAGGTPTLILETVGAKSGQRREALLGYFTEPPDAWLVVASMSGTSWNPAWLHNLAKDPDATIELADGTRIPVRAEMLEAADLDTAWRRIELEAHQYSDYRSKTDREISLVRLRRRPAA
jgi:deazaflavin-dependent oxidoreductase (nitroreductase family)